MTTASKLTHLAPNENMGDSSVYSRRLIEEINSATLIQSLHNLDPYNGSTDEIIQLHFSAHNNYCLGINYFPMLIGQIDGVRKCH